MIIELSLERWRRAVFWDGECPARFRGDDTIHRVIDVSGPPSEPRRVAIELVVPVEPMIRYGLIGGEYVPAAGQHLNVDVSFVNGRSDVLPAFDSRIAYRSEVTTIGLQREYVQGAVAGLTRAIGEGRGPGPGTLVIDCAAGGDVGSSHFMFDLLGGIVVTLLSPENVPPTETLVRRVLTEKIGQR